MKISILGSAISVKYEKSITRNRIGKYYTVIVLLGPVVQSWISANPGLKFNPLLWFMYFCMSAYFKTLENETSDDPDKISEKMFCMGSTVCFEFHVNPGLS
jgi:hypothetical protein